MRGVIHEPRTGGATTNNDQRVVTRIKQQGHEKMSRRVQIVHQPRKQVYEQNAGRGAVFIDHMGWKPCHLRACPFHVHSKRTIWLRERGHCNKGHFLWARLRFCADSPSFLSCSSWTQLLHPPRQFRTAYSGFRGCR